MKNFYNNHKESFIILSISLLYALIFGGYTLCNQYLLVIYPDIGIYLSSLLFASMLVCTILSPYVSHYLITVKWTVILGTLGTTIWLISFNIDVPYLIIFSTICSGIGTGLYRSHQFILIKKLYPENVSRNMAISLSVFNMFGIFTAPIIFIMLFFEISIFTVLKCFVVVVVVSQLLLILVKNVKSEKKQLNYCNLLKTKIWLLLPLSQVQAINFATFFVFIPKNINEHFESAIILIATLALVYSFISPLTTYLVGVLFNKTVSYRWIYFVVSITLSFVVSSYLLYLFDFYKPHTTFDYILICVFGLLYACYDSIIYTINMIVMAELFDENAFCIQRIFYCSSVTIFVMFVKILSSYFFLGLIILLNVLSLIGYLILTRSCDKNRDNYEEILV